MVLCFKQGSLDETDFEAVLIGQFVCAKGVMQRKSAEWQHTRYTGVCSNSEDQG